MEVDGFPPGVRFLPTDQQCILYLTRKFTSQPLPFHGLFLDLDPYNLKHLPHIFSSAENKGEVYTFTTLHRKGKFGNTKANRRVGNGTWHGDRTFEIWNEKDETHIGMSHKFSYREKGTQFDHWFLMTEYTLLKGTSLQYDPLKDYVLCHIVKKGWSHNGKKFKKSKTATPNHQVAAAVFQQPEPIFAGVAAENQSFSGFENPSTSSYPCSVVDTPTFVQNLDDPLGDQEDLMEILMFLDYESEVPSLESSVYLNNVE